MNQSGASCELHDWKREKEKRSQSRMRKSSLRLDSHLIADQDSIEHSYEDAEALIKNNEEKQS